MITISNDNNKISQVEYIKVLLSELAKQITPAQIKALKIDSVLETLPVYQTKSERKLTDNTDHLRSFPAPADFKAKKVVLKKIASEVNRLAPYSGQSFVQPSGALLASCGLIVSKEAGKHHAKVMCEKYLDEAARQGLISYWSARGQGRGKRTGYRGVKIQK